MCNCKNKCKCKNTCKPVSCACPVLISSDCVEKITEDLACSNIPKGQTLTAVLQQLDAYICDRFESTTNFFNLINVGTGSQVYKGISNLGKKELRTLVDSGLINLTQGVDTITISVDETAMNDFIEANQRTYSTQNVGVGAEIYKNTTVTGDNSQFNLRKLKSTDGSITISQGTDDINLTVPFPIVPDGSETKIVAGANGVVTGTGTILNPYVISSDGGETKVNSGTNTTVTGNGTTATPYVVNSVDTTYSAGTAMSLVGTTFNNTAPDQTVTLIPGGATTITGTYPNFTISSINTIADGSETKITAGSGVSVTGTGTTGSPYVVSSTASPDTMILRGLITQVGSTNPTFTVSKNTTGGGITSFTRIGGGVYNMVTDFTIPSDANYRITLTVENKSVYINRFNANTLQFKTRSTNGNLVEDDGMLYSPFELIIDL